MEGFGILTSTGNSGDSLEAWVTRGSWHEGWDDSGDFIEGMYHLRPRTSNGYGIADWEGGGRELDVGLMHICNTAWLWILDFFRRLFYLLETNPSFAPFTRIWSFRRVRPT